jgi:hypothetical protein
MRSVLIRAAMIGVLPLLASACGGGGRFPASPVAAPLSETEAATLAESKLGDRLEGTMLTSIAPTGKGYLLGYVGKFDAGAEPPKPSTLVAVKHDGTVRAYDFGGRR